METESETDVEIGAKGGCEGEIWQKILLSSLHSHPYTHTHTHHTHTILDFERCTLLVFLKILRLPL